MSLENLPNNRSALIRLGMLCLILANAMLWFVHPTDGLGGELRDGLMGLLFGLSFGFNLLAVRLAARRRCG